PARGIGGAEDASALSHSDEPTRARSDREELWATTTPAPATGPTERSRGDGEAQHRLRLPPHLLPLPPPSSLGCHRGHALAEPGTRAQTRGPSKRRSVPDATPQARHH